MPHIHRLGFVEASAVALGVPLENYFVIEVKTDTADGDRQLPSQLGRVCNVCSSELQPAKGPDLLPSSWCTLSQGTHFG